MREARRRHEACATIVLTVIRIAAVCQDELKELEVAVAGSKHDTRHAIGSGHVDNEDIGSEITCPKVVIA